MDPITTDACPCGEPAELTVETEFPISLCQFCYDMLAQGLSLRVDMKLKTEKK